MRLKESKSVIAKPKKYTLKKSLGPLPDLESHVHPEWWKYIFNSLYIKTDADVVEDDSITKQEADLVTEILDLEPQSAILDLCCGQGDIHLSFSKEDIKTRKV